MREVARAAYPRTNRWFGDLELVRNDSAFIAEHNSGKIRVNICFIEAIREANRFVLQSDEHRALLLGILAHEVGHFLDANYWPRRRWSSHFAGDGIAGHGKELWADAVAGCILARAGLARGVTALGPLEIAFEAALRSKCDAPSPAARRRAAEQGWALCEGQPLAALPHVLSPLSPNR